jgi:prepilin-type N-terminal cleavage/methylation domain-containing protein
VNQRGSGRGGDGGFTVLELAVSLAIMSIVGAMFAATMVQVTGMHRTTSALGDAEAQVSRAFRRLDNELRYAADMRTQVVADTRSPRQSLLYLSTAVEPRCHALSLVDGALHRREWSPRTALGAPQVLASGLVVIGQESPFTVTVAAEQEAETGDRLDVEPKVAAIAVAAVAGGAAGTQRREFRARFVAPNTVHGPRGVSLEDCLP